MRNATGKPTNRLNLLSRESLLRANSELIEQLQARLKAKRFRPQEGDSIKLAYIRVFIQALQVQNAILKDQVLEDFKQRLEALEFMQTGSLAMAAEEEDPIFNSDSDLESQGPEELFNY